MARVATIPLHGTGTASFTGRFPAWRFQIDLPRVIKWLWLDAVLWSSLALYLGEVVPQEFGVAKKCWFPITELRAWLRRKAPEAAPDDYEALDGGEASEGAVEFAGLAKTFGSFKAVDGAALRSTTASASSRAQRRRQDDLLRMLTGLLPPDHGEAAAEPRHRLADA